MTAPTVEKVTEPESAAATARRALGRVGSVGPLLSLLGLIVVLSILSPYFLTFDNLVNVFQQIDVLAIIALGATMVIIAGGIDLSVGSVAAVSGVVAGTLFTTIGLPLGLSLVVALAAGAAAGLASGALIVFFRVPPFVATLAMLSIARGLTLVLSDGQPVSGYPGWFRAFANAEIFGFIPVVVLLVLALYVVVGFYLSSRPGGRDIYAVGGNEEVARLTGIAVGRLKLRVYAIAGLLSALGGLILTARLNSAQPTAGTGLELDVIAAVVIGGTSLTGGVGKVTGTLIGALIIGVLRNGLNLLDVSSFWQQIVIGAVIALAVAVDAVGRRRTAGSGR